jgi:hypothetical protein
MSVAPNWLSMVALLAPMLSFGASPDGLTLKIQVQPSELRLAEGGRVRVRIASAEVPVVTVNAGRIDGLREVSSGIYEAQYAPPDSTDPLIAFVTAVTPSGGFGWTTISLAGVRSVEVKAPHRALVSVSVDGQDYGPIPADGTGRAVLRVDVPPGVYFATSKGRRMELDVPRRSFSHVVLDSQSVEAAASATVGLRVIALGDSGQPLAKIPVKLEATEGTLSKPTAAAPGVYQATWTVGPGPVRAAKVTARLGSKPPSTATASLARVPGAPAAVRLATDRTKLVAGETDELAVTGRVVDAGGNTTDAPARLLVSLGSGSSARLLSGAVIEWQQADDASYVGRVQVPRQRSGRQQLELKMIGPKGLDATHVLDLVPGPAANVRVEPDEALYADGHSRQLRVVLVDKYGNRTEGGGNAEVTAVRGTVGAPSRAAPGVYVVDYRSPLSSTDYNDVIRTRVGPLEGQTEVRVRARGGVVVAGLKGGYAMGTGSLSSPAGAVELGFWRPSFSTSLGLVLEIRYFSFGRDETLTAGGVAFPVTSDGSFIAIEPSLAWRRPLARGMLWLGAGPGLVRTSATVSTPGLQDDLSATSWVPSAHASVGWGLPLGPGIPFAELKGAWQGESDGPVSGSLQTVTFNLGYRFDVL